MKLCYISWLMYCLTHILAGDWDIYFVWNIFFCLQRKWKDGESFTKLWRLRKLVSRYISDSVVLYSVKGKYWCSGLINGFLTRVTRGMPQVEQERLAFMEHSSPPQFSSGVRVARSLVFCVVFCVILSFCSFSFAHCIVSPSVYIFWLPSLISSNFSQYYYGCSCYLQPFLSIIMGVLVIFNLFSVLLWVFLLSSNFSQYYYGCSCWDTTHKKYHISVKIFFIE
jgi:hypothetical protein